MNSITSTQSYAGKYFIISGFTSYNSNGYEVFIGKAIDEPFNDSITVEGKSICYGNQGFMTIKPFNTTITFPFKDTGYQIQQLTHNEARNEAQRILQNNVTQIYRATYPFLYRWVESSASNYNYQYGYNNTNNGYYPAFNNNVNYNSSFGFGFNGYYAHNTTNPFFSFYQGFTNSAEFFRRILFQSPQVNSTREMDKITELEGNLTIEIGKITNQTAIKFNQLVSRESELTHYFDAIQGFNGPVPNTNYVFGWIYLMARLQIAKNWAVRNGKTPLVREINTFIKEGITNLNDVILEHCTTLDTLITETCGHYGITLEIFGDLSPFSSYTTPYSHSTETLENNTSNYTVGAGI